MCQPISCYKEFQITQNNLHSLLLRERAEN